MNELSNSNPDSSHFVPIRHATPEAADAANPLQVDAGTRDQAIEAPSPADRESQLWDEVARLTPSREQLGARATPPPQDWLEEEWED